MRWSPAASEAALAQQLECLRRGATLIERTRDREYRQVMLSYLVRDLRKLLRLVEGASQELRLAALSLEQQFHQLRRRQRQAAGSSGCAGKATEHRPAALAQGQEFTAARVWPETEGQGISMNLHETREPIVVGNHWTGFEPPDIICLSLRGEVSLAEAGRINAANIAYAANCSRFFYLIDMGGRTNLGAEVRKSVQAALRNLPLKGTAIFNADLASRVIAKLLLTAVRLARGGDDNPITYHWNEESARRWLEERRQQLVGVEADATILQKTAGE